MPKIMHKILWQWKRNELQNIWILIYRGAFLSKYWHIQRTSWIHRLTVVKNNLHSNIHTDRDSLDLNCHFYVVEATLEANVRIFKTKII